MQTLPFYESHSFVSRLPEDEIITRLSRKFAEEKPTDDHFFNGKTNVHTFIFHRVIAWGARNSFNPICYGEVVPGVGKKSEVHIKMRIAYPIYVLWLIIFSMTVFGHITLTYEAFQTDGVMGVLFATGVMAIFYGAHYLFYRFGFKRNTKKTMLFLVPYLNLRPNGQ